MSEHRMPVWTESTGWRAADVRVHVRSWGHEEMVFEIPQAERLAADLAIAASAARAGHHGAVEDLGVDAAQALRMLADRMEGT